MTRQLYFEQIQRFTLPDGKTIDIMRDYVHLLHHKGDIKPLCRFIETKIFPIFSNRDSLHANEQTVKTLFMALLYEAFNYTLRSEAELGHGYADLVLELRAEARKFELFDLLIEFKYVKLSDVKLDGAAVRAMCMMTWRHCQRCKPR